MKYVYMNNIYALAACKIVIKKAYFLSLIYISASYNVKFKFNGREHRLYFLEGFRLKIHFSS